MNFQNLQYFLITCEEMNITKAAERIHVSQQALSNLIGRMEEELNCKLFSRRPDFELTYAGKCFRDAAMRMLDLENQTRSVLDDISHNRRGELRIGISHTRGQAILPFILPRFCQKYPDIQISIKEGVTRQLEESLEKGNVDILIGHTPFLLEAAEYVDLMQERMYLLIPKSLMEAHFGEMAPEIAEVYRVNSDIGVFRDLPFVLLNKGDRIRTMVDSEFYRAGISPNIRLQTPNIQVAIALASEGLGVTACPELYLNNPYTIHGAGNEAVWEKLEIFPFVTDHVHNVGIGYNRERYLSSFARDFIDICMEEFGSGRIVGMNSVLV